MENLVKAGCAGVGAFSDWYEKYGKRKPVYDYGTDEAREFAERNGVKLYVLSKGYGRYFPDDRYSRWVYKMRLERNGESYMFTFGQSIEARDTVPSYYDVLASLTKSDPYDFDNFCDEYGYNRDSRSAYKTYQAVQKEYNAVERLFGDVMDELQEIY